MMTDARCASVMEYLQGDHRRLDAIMNRCRDQVESGDIDAAAATFKSFRDGLVRHIKIEEGLLFPALEKATGLARAGGPTGAMRFEHEEILRVLGLIRDLFDGEGPSAGEFDSLRSQLLSLLREHNHKEEQIIYPMTDRSVPADELCDLLSKMMEF